MLGNWHPIAAAAAATVAFAAATASRHGPVDAVGRLRHTAYAEIAAMPPTIEEFQHRADTMHLPIDCKRTVGRLGTIRIEFPKGTLEDVIERLVDKPQNSAPASRLSQFKLQMVYAGMRRTRGACVNLRPPPPLPPASLASTIQLMGMERQLEPIRTFATAHGWKIICEGHAGEERVLRIRFPRHRDAAVIDSFFPAARPPATSLQSFYPGQRVPASCDMKEPAPIETDAMIRVLAIGSMIPLSKLAGLARECGFANAHVRPFSDGDLPSRPPTLRADWMTLDAGEDVTRRYGPFACFVLLQREVVAEQVAAPDAVSRP